MPARRLFPASLRNPRCWHAAIAGFVAAITLLVSQPARAGEPGCCGAAARPQDEIWLIDTRATPCGVVPPGRMPAMAVSKFTDGVWQSTDMKSFLYDGSDLTTIVYVHGNRVDSDEARGEGLEFYRQLIVHADDAPLRVVIWSWPASQIKGPLKDVRLKAERSDPSGYQLAWVLDRLAAKTSVSLVGFSFGARIAIGALHLLGGGALDEYQLEERVNPDRAPVRVVTWAAAMDNRWLLPSSYHGQALSQAERMLLLNNSCDRALRRFYMIDKCTSPTALGYAGLAAPQRLGDDAAKIEQVDVCCNVGNVHSVDSYLASDHVIALTWSGIQSTPRPAEVAKAKPAAPKSAKK